VRLGVLALALTLPLSVWGQQQDNQGVPDAPSPQTSNSLGNLTSGVAPGKGAPPPAPEPAPEAAPAPDAEQQGPPPQMPSQGELDKTITTFRANVTAVILPVTVLDRKHQQVSGLTYRDFEVLEDNIPQHIFLFSSDPRPLSVALVIDQSLPQDVMQKVNDSMHSIQAAFTPSDEVAVFTYSDGVSEQTTFTGSQSARLPAVLEASKKSGDDMGAPFSAGPLYGGPQVNGHSIDPNLEPGRDVSGPAFPIIPKEIHTLNDAILAAGKALSTRPHDRLRIIYVISDGKESRSKASFKEVVHYLQQNQISVYGTLVGDSATWGLGYLDKFKLPLLPLSADNILPRYVNETGGHLEAQFSQNGIERSFADLAALSRTQYTIGYYSHIPVLDGKYRTVEVRVKRPAKSIDVITEKGYYPTATNLNQ
jgi:VWFA-related protein